MKSIASVLFAVAAVASAAQAVAQVTIYENEGFQGRSFTSQRRVDNLERAGFNDRASSVTVAGQRWQACADARMEGSCTVLRPGRYPSLQAMGLNDRVTSLRPLPADRHVAEQDYAPWPQQDYSRRRDERLYDANVTSARAVVGTPAQRCWMEREQVAQPQQQQGSANVPGAVVGAVVGGILGHQVGGGTGKTVATVAGAAGGAAVGSQYGRNPVAPPTVGHDVQRCDSNPAQATPSYWDVTYDFRGREHRVQMVAAPGRTVTVNRNGEPRV